jgi:transposase-like protein
MNTSTALSYNYERKPKVVLGDREMYMVRLLRQNNIRTMDIAKLMKISERSVTRLLARSKDLTTIDFEEDFVAEVDKLLAEKDLILNSEISSPEVSQSNDEEVTSPKPESSKLQLANSLLAMNVKIKDISKMLDVPENTVQRWKTEFREASLNTDEVETGDYEILSPREVDEVEIEVYDKGFIKDE